MMCFAVGYMEVAMKKIAIYGAGGTGRMIADQLLEKGVPIECFFDGDSTKCGGGRQYRNISIRDAEEIRADLFDEIIIGAASGHDEMREKLHLLHIPDHKINDTYLMEKVKARKDFLYRFAEIVEENNRKGNVAEAGVFRGEFAKEINRAFSDRMLYLFDTFQGFDSRDFQYEKIPSNAYERHFQNTSVNYVLSRMKYKEKCIVKQGYFPDTAVDVQDVFCFVSLDMDLFKPIYEGLKFFYPKMTVGGVILIDDYFSKAYPNVKEAVAAYEKEFGIGLLKVPIGDNNGLVVIKK